MSRRFVYAIGMSLVVFAITVGESSGRGFGGFRGGGFHGGGGFRGGLGGVRTNYYHGFRGVSGPRYGGLGGSYGGRFHTRTTTYGPFGASTRGTTGFTRTTAGGYRITGGATAGRRVGPYGGRTGGAAGGVRLTTPSGQTYGRAGARRATVGPEGGFRSSGVGVRGTTGPRGTAFGARSGTAVGRTGTLRRFPTDTGLARYTTAGFRGRRGTFYRSGSAWRTQAGFVRGGFIHYGAFSAGWFRRFPRAWRPFRYAAASLWIPCTWPICATWIGCEPTPVYYDYGTNVVYQDNSVYIDGQPYTTQQEYEQQAASLAETGKKAEPTKEDTWRPLGVFAMVQGDEKTSNTIFQLAVDKKGIIRGNYYDALSETTLPVYGSVDKKTQRAAWTVGDNKLPVYEAGIANLTKDETTMLVHFGPDKTQQWLLVRMEKPSDQDGQGDATKQPGQ